MDTQNKKNSPPSETLPKMALFKPMHEIWNFLGPNYIFWNSGKVPLSESIQNVYQAPFKCLNKWIKVDKLDYFKKWSQHFKNYFYFRFLWISRTIGSETRFSYSFMLKYSKITVWTKSIAWLDITSESSDLNRGQFVVLCRGPFLGNKIDKTTPLTWDSP